MLSVGLDTQMQWQYNSMAFDLCDQDIVLTVKGIGVLAVFMSYLSSYCIRSVYTLLYCSEMQECRIKERLMC